MTSASPQPRSSPRRAGRPSVEESDRLEREIVGAALKEFQAQGLQGASVERIARAAGVTRSALYRRYRDKRGLFDLVLAHYVAMLKQLADNVSRDADDPLLGLRDAARTYCRSITSPTVVDLQRMMIWRAADPAEMALADLPSLPAELSDQLDAMIIQAQAAGRLRAGCPVLLRDVLLRLVAEGIHWKTIASSQPLDDATVKADFDRMWPVFLQLASQ